jgi:hypothetical protein
MCENVPFIARADGGVIQGLCHMITVRTSISEGLSSQGAELQNNHINYAHSLLTFSWAPRRTPEGQRRVVREECPRKGGFSVPPATQKKWNGSLVPRLRSSSLPSETKTNWEAYYEFSEFMEPKAFCIS